MSSISWRVISPSALSETTSAPLEAKSETDLNAQGMICVPVAFKHNGAVSAEAKHGPMTLARFDGDNGEYSLLLGHAKGIDGPFTKGTYLWVEVANLKRLEAKVVEGPYIHHCVGLHGDVVPVLYEACKYLGIKPDLYDPIEDKVKAYLHGEDVVFDEI